MLSNKEGTDVQFLQVSAISFRYSTVVLQWESYLFDPTTDILNGYS